MSHYRIKFFNHRSMKGILTIPFNSLDRLSLQATTPCSVPDHMAHHLHIKCCKASHVPCVSAIFCMFSSTTTLQTHLMMQTMHVCSPQSWNSRSLVFAPKQNYAPQHLRCERTCVAWVFHGSLAVGSACLSGWHDRCLSKAPWAQRPADHTRFQVHSLASYMFTVTLWRYRSLSESRAETWTWEPCNPGHALCCKVYRA